MDTQTDQAAGRPQVHPIVQHHQQRNSGSSSSSSSNNSNNASSSSGSSTTSTMNAGQRESTIGGSSSSNGANTSSMGSSNNDPFAASSSVQRAESMVATVDEADSESTSMRVSFGQHDPVSPHRTIEVIKDDHSLMSHSPLNSNHAVQGSPMFSSYCISSTPSAGNSPLRRHLGRRISKHSMPTSPLRPNNQSNKFITPNALLHQRLIAKSSKGSKSPFPRRSKGSPRKQIFSIEIAVAETEQRKGFQEQRRSSLGDAPPPCPTSSCSTTTVSSKPTSSSGSIDVFQLQPVPASKRRRTNAQGKERSSNMPSMSTDKRRKREMEAKAGSTSSSSSNRQCRSLLTPGVKSSKLTNAPLTTTFNHRLTGSTVEKTQLGQVEAREFNYLMSLSSPSTQSQSRIPRPRLSRTQSLPNLKAKPVLDIEIPAVHRLALPPRLVEYLSLLRDKALRQQQQQQQQQQNHQGHDGTIPLSSQRDRPTFSASSTSALASSFARNGYCTTTIDSMGNVKSIFLPSLHPPITRQTLKELDLHEILKNPQLRHDIVFDSNVQFRPNFDGERGRKKKEFGNKYWYAIQKEIETGCTCTSFSGKVLLPCMCGMDNGKTAVNRYTGNLASIKSPMPSLANYAHSGSGFNGLFSARNSRHAMPQTPATNAKTPRTAVGLAGGRIPSRIPLLIQELRAICLSVLPSPSTGTEGGGGGGGNATPARPFSAQLNSTVPSSITKAGSQQQQSVQSSITPSTSRSVQTPLTTGTTSVATHHLQIAQILDPHLITQQLQHGVLDIASLMTFLGSILKLHCAPMRDEVIEKMIRTVCNEGEVAIGLRMCFEILELMKLDIANHQLRSSRMYLIETAVDFEIRWFRDQMDQSKSTLDRTSLWFQSSLRQQQQKKSSSTATKLTRTEVISKAFDDGLMRLIFEPPLTITNSIVGANSVTVPPSPLPVASPSTLSSASLNHAYTSSYPETFQFDAYRLMTFHGDVTDITIVYMLLLLFRQLACSSSNLSQQPQSPTTLSSSAILENASGIASRQLSSIKSEIWTLLNDADSEVSTGPSGGQGNLPRTAPTTPGLAGRVLNYNAVSGSFKLENPNWRKAMNDVVLQIAARAIEVQIQARKEVKDRSATSSAPSPLSPCPPPSEETMKLLLRWMETNLQRGSALHKLCQSRLRNVLCAFLDDGKSKPKAIKMARKEREEEMGAEDDNSGSKRIRLQQGSVSIEASKAVSVSTSAATIINHDDLEKSEVELAIQKGGLEPFTAEIKLLSERIIKVKTFHLRVFRCAYEKITQQQQQQHTEST